MDLISSGEFHLDPIRAREKLREFQLPSPAHYALELVKAAHLVEATRIVFDVEDSWVRVWFDGERFSTKSLSQLYSAVFVKQETPVGRALGHVAMAVNALEGGGASTITITTGGESSRSVRFVDGEATVLDGTSARGPGTVIEVVRSRGRLAGLLQRFRGQEMTELDLLREKVVYARTNVIVNDERVNRGFFIADEEGHPMSCRYVKRSGRWVPQAVGSQELDMVRRFESPLPGADRSASGFVERGSVAIGAHRGRAPSHRLQVVQEGVTLLDKRGVSPLHQHSVHTLVESPAVNTDISQSAVAEDQSWDALQARVNGHLLIVIAEYLEARASAHYPIHDSTGWRLVVDGFSIASNLSPEAADAYGARIAELPVLISLDRETGGPGDPISPAQAIEDGRIYFVTEGERTVDGLARIPATQPVVLWRRGSQEVEILHHFAPVLEDLHWGNIHDSRPTKSGAKLVHVDMDASLPPEPPRTLPPEPPKIEDDLIAALPGDDLSIRWIDGDGTRALRPEGSSFVADRNAPAIRQAIDRPRDLVARAFAITTLFADLAPHLSPHSSPRDPLIAAHKKRRFIRELTSPILTELGDDL